MSPFKGEKSDLRPPDPKAGAVCLRSDSAAIFKCFSESRYFSIMARLACLTVIIYSLRAVLQLENLEQGLNCFLRTFHNEHGHFRFRAVPEHAAVYSASARYGEALPLTPPLPAGFNRVLLSY